MTNRDRDVTTRGGLARLALLSIPFLAFLTECQGPGQGGESFSRKDSAGVVITESNRPLWESGEGWTLSREPEVVIGLREGDERYLLDGVRGVRRLSDGRIAVLDAGSYRVRLYDSTGVHLVDFGGRGDGPSEFRTPQFLGVVSDTLFVFEAIGGSRTWFSPDGELLRTSTPFEQDQREKGTLLMIGTSEGRIGVGAIYSRGLNRRLLTGLNREPWSIWRFGLSSSLADSLFSVPGGEVMILESGPRGTLQRTYVFGKYTALAVSDRWIYVGPTDEYSIQVFDQEGTLRRIIRRDAKPRRVAHSDLGKWVEGQLELRDASPEERAELRRLAPDLSVAETMPAFKWIVADSEDNLWVEEWEGVGLGQGSFSVFRRDGAWLGSVDIPDGLPELRMAAYYHLMEIGSDFLLGVWTDQVGVEQVRLYRIKKDEQP